jgi:4-aminobutyrate aminotransferase-like enzyme/Ser/Thr protein kinase RdoA (MazF antagonist)
MTSPDAFDHPLFNFFDHGALVSPSLPIDEVSALLRREFGLEVLLSPLGSQQDQNFLATRPGDGIPFGVLKISHPAFSDAEIALQNMVSSHLANALPDLRVTTILTHLDRPVSAWLDTSEGRRHVRLFSYLPGGTFTRTSTLTGFTMTRMGEIAGRVSRALASVSHPAAARTTQWDLRHAQRTLETIAWSGTDAERALVDEASSAAWAIVTSVEAALPQQLGHFDLTDDNLIASLDPLPLPDGIIDFGDVASSWAIAELAVTLSSLLHHDHVSPKDLVSVVQAFHDQRPMSDEEVVALWPLVVLRGAVLVVSGRQQADLDPDNHYAATAHDREWRIFERACALPPLVMTTLLREALGSVTTTPEPPSTSSLLLPTAGDAVVVLDTSVTSPLNDNGAWMDVAIVEQAALRALDNGSTLALVPFDAVVLAGAPPLSMMEPPTITTGLTLWTSTERALTAPMAGQVSVSPHGVTLTAAESTITLHGAVAVSGGSVEAGTVFATVPARSELTIQFHSSAVTSVPTKIPASCLSGWLTVAFDPAPLIGLTRHQRSHTSTLLVRRGNVLAEVQEHYYDQPPQIERGWKEFLIDVNGRVYLDMVNNVSSVGHSHPRIAEAASRQLHLLNTNSRFNYEAITNYAEELAATLPDELDTVFLVNSGSEAVDLAIRIAMAATGRRDIVAMREAYHGWTFASDAVSTSIADNPNALSSRPAWVHTVDSANSYRGTHRGPEAYRYAEEAVEVITQIAASGTPLAGFLAEPYFGNTGGVALPPGYLQAVYAAIREQGGVAIADEVQVGFGRLGQWFWGFQEQDVVPDIVAIAKSIGGGYPLGAVITSKAVAAMYRTQGYFFSSTGGCPLSSVVGSTVLSIIREEELQENARTTGSYIKSRLEALQTRNPLIGITHGSGLYLGTEFVRDHTTLEPATEETNRICNELLRLGVIMQPTGDFQNVLKIKPPLIIRHQSIDFFATSLAIAIETLVI